MEGVVVVLVIAAVYLGLVARIAVLFRRSRPRPFVHTAHLASGDNAAARLVEGLTEPMHRHGFHLVHHGSEGLSFERRYRPGWAVLVATLFFWLLWPLLFLLVTRRAVVTVSLEQIDGEDRTMAAGTAPEPTIDLLRRSLSAADTSAP